MAGFLTKIKSASSASQNQTPKDTQAKRKDEVFFEVTPLERMLQNAGPLREDGNDRFFGFENFGNTCYCNSIVQALFYSDLFRQRVINYPSYSPPDTPNGTRPKVNVTLRPPMNSNATTPQQKHKNGSTSQMLKQRQTINSGQTPPGQPIKPEDKPDTPEYKKKQAMLKGPILELAQENAIAYGMDECTFTGLKDIFLALLDSSSRTGVLSPQRFLEIFKRDNELFRNSMHQDAHEFYGLVLNDVISNVEKNARRSQEPEGSKEQDDLTQSVGNVVESAVLNHANGYQSPGIGWVHDIFEGVLTSETRCLTCETASQRDETFLDLSIDLEEHASVTSCLRKFSAEEMLCERNKFHCDHCGGLQEAEKRMKVKRLPKILTLHLKRFKYTEDYSRLQKLFHRVVYPYHLRMFNTTDDAEDPDRLYELYAVVVHIGGNAYHGHYVSIIKTSDRGWLLFDDEMVEPVDKHFVRNFFGDKPGMATAYVLFYQETTFEKVRQEQEKEGMEEVKLATQAANVAHEDSEKLDSAPLKRQATQPVPPIPKHGSLLSLAHAQTAPDMPTPTLAQGEMPAVLDTASAAPTAGMARMPTAKQDGFSKEDRRRERKEREAAEKAAKQAEKEKEKQAKAAAKEEEKAKERQTREEERKRREDHVERMQARRNEQDKPQGVLDTSKNSPAHEDVARKKDNVTASGTLAFLDRPKRGSKSMSRKSFNFFHKDKMSNDNTLPDGGENGETSEKPEKTKGRLSIGLGRKKSSNLLS
ncbi:hypothetical protein C2857_003750 [Epichloe festucae Fl1]|uniref:Ubiquitin carboxyl-terminal hydrolase n=2 Tax=Opisthokonta TaxID=33154 RepID=A0A7S9KS78_EPIFF|nr:hypothetical protein C2857_003750 [Epichloe festucae Fl1]